MSDTGQVSELIRDLTSCKQQAERIGLGFLSDLLAMALLETALQAIGGKEALANPNMRLERLIELKLRTALGGGSGQNIVPMCPEPHSPLRSRREWSDE
ncbi:hypothetical protein SAMN04515647_3460 [Cohaesibacter sp. ES.047]|uniref:hypothetical protein n=1 Tax=Cohaesibacter sp. ES.047 TaxID=1798205 RepID=UPI000BB6CE33|nr:hypothetical protein [Cohaesibacter sp. ES.047]SNY93172.1 hypothetical protein SAMN04515647_3460 [Cohaesibacter sp. ES.047]